MWTFETSTGTMYKPDGSLHATGYSGAREGKNNPSWQGVPMMGPIPSGNWRIGPAFHHPLLGDLTMPLLPVAGTNAYGRTAFRIHGDSRSSPGNASEGCIVIDHEARAAIADSKDRDLLVVEKYERMVA